MGVGATPKKDLQKGRVPSSVQRRPEIDPGCGIIHTEIQEKNKKMGVKTPALTLEGRGNDLVVFVVRCFCCSQVFSVLYCKYQCRNALIFV
jgi:hypothetical protein